MDGAVWSVNQEIVFTFNDAVDFSSVSANTISIQTTAGVPATGSYFARGANQIVFQPNCPTLENRSDSGLLAGPESYQIRVLGRSSGAVNTVRSTSGARLEVTQVRNFTTPVIDDAFLDTDLGTPVPIVRAQGSTELAATYLEVGGDPDNRVYFELDPSQNLVLSVPGFEAAHNLFSDRSTRVAVVIEFNQALLPGPTNISSNRLRLEFLDGLTWIPLDTRVELVSNCTETGARVRLEPMGILPRGRTIRAVASAVQDLVGESSVSNSDSFAIFTTREVDFESLSPAEALSDEFDEEFDFGGSSESSFEDTEALFASPFAVWEAGSLTAAFQFDGSGGPGGNFDWVVRTGDSFLIDTSGQDSILGADGVTVQTINQGLIEVRNLVIEAGGEVRVQGSRPLRINATGDVIIRGLLDVSGFNASDVFQLNTGSIREDGGSSGPGGGRGGHANEVVTNSTSNGGAGQGPGFLLNQGGLGGESGYSSAVSKDARRPGGGGGGRFARNQTGLLAQPGTDGNLLASGALTAMQPPRGGAIGIGPFLDDEEDNDFFGTRAVGSPGNVTELIRGELAALSGGFGGGGGGNAIPSATFPPSFWTPSSDEKGGAGGGGGGALHLRALGVIQFGASGLIRADGGRGGIGENVLGQDHIGGSGGSGSGGHVILETATRIDFTDGGLASNAGVRDWLSARGGPQVTGAPTSGGAVSFGGAGGPGVIQLHVPDSTLPASTDPNTSDLIVSGPVLGAPDAVDAATSPKAEVLIPSFGTRSLARSKWISIGAADEQPNGIPAQLLFLFQGTDTTNVVEAERGKVLLNAQQVAELDPLLDDALEGNPDATVLSDRLTLQLTGGALDPFTGSTQGVSNDLYLRTPTLLENFLLRLHVGAVSEDFTIAEAQYDEGSAGVGDEALRLTALDEGTDLRDFISANTALGNIGFRLIPRFFRVVTGGVANSIPADSFVRIRFQATDADVLGAPNAAAPLVDWTADIAEFNSLGAGQLQFFRFEVEFELNENGGTVSPDLQPVTLDFLRIPFLF